MFTVIALGLVNWMATTILVESKLFRPLRQFVNNRRFGPRKVLWDKLSYLVGCHLCTGTWVGLAQAAVFGSPWSGWYGWIAGGLLYKAVGHLVLELRPQAWARAE